MTIPVVVGFAWLFILTVKVFLMSEALDRIKREVAETRGVANSAIQAFSSIPQLIRDAVAEANANGGSLDQALNALADELDASQADLALAIQTNIPEPSAGGEETETAPAGEDTLTGGQGDDTIETGRKGR